MLDLDHQLILREQILTLWNSVEVLNLLFYTERHRDHTERHREEFIILKTNINDKENIPAPKVLIFYWN
jgi:hypothetical protein